MSDNVEIVRLLLQHPDIDSTIKNNNGRVAEGSRWSRSNAAILQLIRQHSSSSQRERLMQQIMIFFLFGIFVRIDLKHPVLVTLFGDRSTSLLWSSERKRLVCEFAEDWRDV